MRADDLLTALRELAKTSPHREQILRLVARLEEGSGSLAEGRRLLAALKDLGEQRRLQ